MSQPEEPSGGAESPEDPAETGDERGGSETVSLDADVEGPINAAVQNSELDDMEEQEEDRTGEDKGPVTHRVEGDREVARDRY